MSDHFGISAAMKAMVTQYSISARRSGRTTSLVESLKTGDRVIFATPKEALHVQRMCRDRGVEIEVITLDPKRRDHSAMFGRPPAEGRTLFDHAWVEQHYLISVIECGEWIARVQRETSGFGAAHRETRERAREIRGWKDPEA